MNKPDDDRRIRQVEGGGVPQDFIELVRVVGEQHQGGESRRADGIALGDRLGGIADGVQRIGHVAHFLVEAGHLGNAAGVVGDRTVGVERDDHAGHRQHGRGGDGDAVQSLELVGRPDAQGHRDHRQCARLHRDAEPGNDVGRVAGLRRRGHVLHRLVFGCRVVLGDHDHRRGEREADQRAQPHRGGTFAHEPLRHEIEGDGGNERRRR